MAHYLYVLMMLLADRNPRNTSANNGFYVNANYDGSGTPQTPTDTAYYFPQWAVNIVDFLDSDSVITPFESTFNRSTTMT